MTPSIPEMTKEIQKQLIKTQLGIEKADLILLNGKLVNVYTKEILDNVAVSIKGEWVAYVGTKPDPTIGPETTVIDIKGQTIIPGLIDGHTHLSWLLDISEFLPYAIIGGTTTIITETMEPFPVAGLQGVEEFLDALAHQPIKIYATAPPNMSISAGTRGISKKDLDKLLSRPDILGLGESYWQAVLQETDRLLPIYKSVMAIGKTIEGHSAGATDRRLAAYVACGISSCHEPISVKEALERLRMGLYVMIREGSIRQDLAKIAPIIQKDIKHRRLILVSDSVDPIDLKKKGYMEYIVQKAIEYGFPPITAIQMATLNVAEHFGIDSYVGGVAPGKQADLLVIPNVRNIKAQIVISRGKIVSKAGKLLTQPRKHNYSKECLSTINLSRPMAPNDFTISSPIKEGYAKVRVIKLKDRLKTYEKHLSVPVIDGKIKANSDNALLKVGAVDRTKYPGKCFTGLIQGFGMRSGALASSASWDSSVIIVVGANDIDMANSVNRVAEMNGGFSLSVKGNVLEEIPLPIFGLISQAKFSELFEAIRSMTSAVQKLGFPYDAPLLTLITLTCQAIPFLRICEEGLVNLKDGKSVGLFVDD